MKCSIKLAIYSHFCFLVFIFFIMERKNRKVKAFTLIEIMVVVLIVGLLAGLVGINVVRYFEKARERTAKTQISMIEQALELYKMEQGRYPTTDEGVGLLVKAGYLKGKEIPKDPWGSEYYYVSDGKTFTLKSAGPDKSIGTQDDISTESQVAQ